jgi:aldose 1-epimerase
MDTKAGAAGVSRAEFGRSPEGETVELVELTVGSGLTVRILTLGATLQSVIAPNRRGDLADVALGFDTVEEYLANDAYMGSTVGRVANRLAGGRFVIDGREHQASLNEGEHSLHGGEVGLDRRNWKILALREGVSPGVRLGCVSPDGDQGYPGELAVTADFTLTPDGVLALDYEATTDQPTLVNITSHAYWNLAGEGECGGAMGHLLTVHADEFLPTDAASIPTGEFRAVDGTPFDFRQPRAVGERVREARDPQIKHGRGYDHNWVIARTPSAEPRLVATLEDPVSGRGLELSSDQPGLQVYSGNFLDGALAGKSRRSYRQGDAVVLEPQMFPDAPNRPEFGSIRLDPGQVYRNRIRFRFTSR